MRIDKNLVVIGLSDDDTAHLRLLMRKAGEQLKQRWRWGTEEGADLVVVDTGAFAGQMARTRALAAGMRVAVVTDEAAESPPELRLHRPLKLPNVVDVLNQAGGGFDLVPKLDVGTDDLYLEFAQTPSSKLDPPDSLARLFGDADDEAAALGLPADDKPLDPDSLFKRDEQAHKPRYSVPLTLDEDTRVERTDGPTPRSEARAFEVSEGLSRQGTEPGPNTLPPVKRGMVVDTSRHALRDYLDGRLLAGPAQIRLDGAVALTLDPKHRMFHSDGGLAQLEAYVREPLAVSDWRRLTTAEINQIRETQPAQPYQHLTWLETLVTSGGRLASQLDPGGTYRLKHWIELDRDVRHHQRIARAMMQPARLNEIAAAANVPMADVFDVVNAYHAIGLVEWETRASLRAPVKDEREQSGGLFSRLKRPFGKS
ncbi:MAG TPA: hypothetical protein VLF18_09655 [Tahibacter sp.]|uniref:hypothetical protein n=1 Tax=Tahibacter sp. TaxID=2056211 RepID=UPI002BE0DB0A|nr:hypothetical protein [Tahibacter sp.]HSX60450.1 hypothetical protein [Tahibacter sp.]